MTNQERARELDNIFRRGTDPNKIIEEMNKLGWYRQLEDGSYLKTHVKDSAWVTTIEGGNT